MGNSQSNFKLYCKISNVMPSVDASGFKGEGPLSGWFDKSNRPFVSNEDRQQFVYACITVISQNGAINLRDHDFRLLYSRRNKDRVVARLVAEKEGAITAQISSEYDGKDQAEAFHALRKHVEIQLDCILCDIPGAAISSDPSAADREQNEQTTGTTRSLTRSGNASSPSSPRLAIGTAPSELQNSSGPISLPADAPPSYGKAVKEWRTNEKK